VGIRIGSGIVVGLSVKVVIGIGVEDGASWVIGHGTRIIIVDGRASIRINICLSHVAVLSLERIIGRRVTVAPAGYGIVGFGVGVVAGEGPFPDVFPALVGLGEGVADGEDSGEEDCQSNTQYQKRGKRERGRKEETHWRGTRPKRKP
jgi:hypothetical protein